MSKFVSEFGTIFADPADHRRLRLILDAAIVIGVINFLSFIAISLAIGGDALNGKIENGQHYLGAHGQFTAVSLAVYHYSLWHVGSPPSRIRWPCSQAGCGAGCAAMVQVERSTHDHALSARMSAGPWQQGPTLSAPTASSVRPHPLETFLADSQRALRG